MNFNDNNTAASTATRKPRRRIVRPLSRFKVGQQVAIDGDYNGDYHGKVIATHNHLTLTVGRYDSEDTATLPGVTVKVTRWEGVDYLGSDAFEIQAHDCLTRLINE